MLKRCVVALATLFGLGNIKFAPGTFGSFAGVIFYSVIIRNIGQLNALLLSLFLILFANIICDLAEKVLQKHDPGEIILDEFVAMPIVFFGIDHYLSQKVSIFLILAAGFAIFRAFDIIKPFGIKKVQELSGGLGVVTDDIVAAVYSNISLAVLALCLTAK